MCVRLSVSIYIYIYVLDGEGSFKSKPGGPLAAGRVVFGHVASAEIDHRHFDAVHI